MSTTQAKPLATKFRKRKENKSGQKSLVLKSHESAYLHLKKQRKKANGHDEGVMEI